MAICLGLMSGTSMDGIDAALIDTDGHNAVRSLGGQFLAYPAVFQHLLKAAELTAKQTQGNALLAVQHFSQGWQTYGESLQLSQAALADLEKTAIQFVRHTLANPIEPLSLDAIIACSTELHCQAAKQLMYQAKLQPADIEVVGYHGQTLYHKPSQRLSWQAGEAQYLADQLGCTVISAFRQADIEQGGQGAPLVPLYHQALINQSPCYPTAVINCGGIANMTAVLGPSNDELIAFDIGPGSVLLDRLVRQQTQGQYNFDRGGLLAQHGQVCAATLAILKQMILPKSFLDKVPPKSLDSYDCQIPTEVHSLSLADGLATLAALSAECIADSLSLIQQPMRQIILAGGGWHHPRVFDEFKRRIKPGISIVRASQKGWSQDLLEAEAFAYLAKRSMLGLSLSTPHTTGVRQTCHGGQCFTPIHNP